jgi:hypothetical protein
MVTPYELAPQISPTDRDIALFGAPGATYNEQNEMELSLAGYQRAAVTFQLWRERGGVMVGDIVNGKPVEEHEWHGGPRVLCVAGSSGIRGGVETESETEADAYARVLVAMGVPRHSIVPLNAEQLGQPFAQSTVQEADIFAGKEWLAPPKKYTEEVPLDYVLHQYHGRRAEDALRKVGYEHLNFVAPEQEDSRLKETIARWIYKAVVIGGNTVVEPGELTRREETRVKRVAGFIGKMLGRGGNKKVERDEQEQPALAT